MLTGYRKIFLMKTSVPIRKQKENMDEIILRSGERRRQPMDFEKFKFICHFIAGIAAMIMGFIAMLSAVPRPLIYRRFLNLGVVSSIGFSLLCFIGYEIFALSGIGSLAKERHYSRSLSQDMFKSYCLLFCCLFSKFLCN